MEFFSYSNSLITSTMDKSSLESSTELDDSSCIASRMDLSYREQCMIQIQCLKEATLSREVGRELKNRRYCKHRLFRQNIFEEIPPRKRQYLEDLLKNALRRFGSHIYRSILKSRQEARTTLASTPTPISGFSLSSPRSHSVSSRNRTNSVSSDPDEQLIQPTIEIIALSSDDEEIDDEEDIVIKEEDERRGCEKSGSEEINVCVSLDDINNSTQKRSACEMVTTILCEGSNIRYDDRGVVHLQSRKKIKYSIVKDTRQELFLHILSKILKLYTQNRFMTKRELYYLSLEHCKVNSRKKDSQNVVKYNGSKLDTAISEMCCLFGCSRVHLRILAQAKGIVYGDLKFQIKNGEIFDALSKKEGILIPSGQQPIVKLESNAKFILVVEKDSVLQKILNLEDRMQFVKSYQIILFTGRGYPDITSRAFLNFLWSKLKIPILALTDADPHGIDIVCAYKFGCFSTAYESVYLAVPQMKWLGFFPGDITKLSLPDDKTINLSKHDIYKIKSLMSRTYLKSRDSWMRQINIMRALKRKAELESLDKSGEYLLKTYIPNKIRYGSWL